MNLSKPETILSVGGLELRRVRVLSTRRTRPDGPTRARPVTRYVLRSGEGEDARELILPRTRAAMAALGAALSAIDPEAPE